MNTRDYKKVLYQICMSILKCLHHHEWTNRTKKFQRIRVQRTRIRHTVGMLMKKVSDKDTGKKES